MIGDTSIGNLSSALAVNRSRKLANVATHGCCRAGHRDQRIVNIPAIVPFSQQRVLEAGL